MAWHCCGSQKFDEARAAVTEDLSSEYPASMLIAAYSDVVNGKLKSAAAEAEAVVKLLPDAGDARYVNSMVIRNLTDSEAELDRAITLSPFASGPYIDFATRLALAKQSDRVDDALKLIDGVIAREPNCISAKLTEVLMLLGKGRVKDAEPLLDFQMRHTPAADVRMIAAIYLTQVQRVGQAQQAWDQARKMDVTHFNFLIVPFAMQFLQDYERKMHYRSDCFLTFETLFPARRAPKPDTAAAAPDPVL